MVSRKEWYERVNATWPSEVPPLSAEEAVRAARKLWRWAMGEKYPGRIETVSGNRYTWNRGAVLYVNPDRKRYGRSVHGSGWASFIHDLSHLLWRTANSSDTRPHEKEHAKLELAMRKEVLKRGWLDGSLKDKPKATKPPANPKAEKYLSIVTRMDRWLAKKKRAERALSKLKRQRRYYERVGVAA